jgi:hypothetical protein
MNGVFVGFSHILVFFLGILIFKSFTARRLYKSFGVKGLCVSRITNLCCYSFASVAAAHSHTLHTATRRTQAVQRHDITHLTKFSYDHQHFVLSHEYLLKVRLFSKAGSQWVYLRYSDVNTSGYIDRQ